MFSIKLEKKQLQAPYDKLQGYGSIDSKLKAKHEQLQINEISNAFVNQGGKSPYYYRVEVPRSGNYKVTLEIEGTEAGSFSLFLERRRCYVKNQRLAKGEKISMTFTCNVCPIIPEGKDTIYEDTGLDITLLGKEFIVTALEVTAVECRTIYMAGDSTSKDQATQYPYNPFTSYCGWVQMLPLFLKAGIALSNHAHSGRTTESFREEGRWNIIKTQLKPKDWVLIQFGHNDQKCPHLEAFGGYSQNLRCYVDEIKACGAYPVIVTPVSRSLWNGPGLAFNDLLETYAKACRQVGEELKVPVLDLHERSKTFIVQQGPIEAMKYFYPQDWTHFNDFGGEEIARLVVAEIEELNLEIKSYVKTRDRSPIEIDSLDKWRGPNEEEFTKMMEAWELSNEWVKDVSH